MSNSIFGSSAPKFVYDLGGVNEATVLLDYCIITRDDPDVRKIVHESELSADRDFITRGDFWEFEVMVNLYKYEDPRNKFEEIYQYKNLNVALWKHRDGSAFLDSSGDEVLFYIDEITPRNLTRLDYKDVLFIRFLSLKEVDFSNSVTVVPNIDEIIMSNDN